MALRAGLPVRDMEMVQFHPTGLLAGSGTRMTGTVLEEGLRGAGGYLLNGDKQRFMDRFDAREERATRDIVSRSIFSEMRDGRISPNGGVYIQMSHLGPDKVRQQFKGMVERCGDCGFDLAGGLVEVVPTAHYMMGGVVFHADCTTGLVGLFAAGEDTGGVHGANRLGGNGVANSTVFGGIAGDSMAAWVKAQGTWRAPDEDAIARSVAWHEAPLGLGASSATASAGSGGGLGGLESIREALFECMWTDVGILRTGAGLQRALVTLAALDERLAQTGVDDGDRAFNLSWHDWINLKNLISVSRVIATSALAREDSRGAHFREDHPQTGDLPSSTFIVVTQTGTSLDMRREPVVFSKVMPGQTVLEETKATTA
jgi:fumarate reductase flavoprotein subunit